ncbi:GNAT family N-acetyltransferase [Streptomyces bikiniensis]|uniref:GNAT family N-acetyltransferase n=1 Tax=Streptomyces bikiniensis TaxID=1896 RepID=UPI00068E6BA8|nr:GNAT family N-acetyltransferase [Streptomyces bikiniensis]
MHAAEHVPILGLPHRGGQSSASVRGRAFVERRWGRAATGAGCPFVLVDPGGRPVGAVGLRPGGEEVTLGCRVVASARGGGAAGAGLAAVADRALRERGVSRPVLHVEPWNTASVRVAERVGFRREGMREGWLRIGGERRDVLVFAPSRRDREAACRTSPAHRPDTSRAPGHDRATGMH